MKNQQDDRLLMENFTAYGIGDPSKDLRIEYHSVNGNFPIFLHWHTYCEFEIVLNGHGTHLLNNSSFPISRGCAHLCMVNDFHKVKNTPSGELYIISVKFQESLIDKRLLSKLEKIYMYRYCKFDNEDDILEICYLLDLLKKIQSTSYKSNSVKQVLIESTLNLILSLFFTQCTNSESEISDQTKNEHRIQKAVAYIHKNFTKNISQADVATYAGLSVYYFSTLFKEQMNCSYSSYLLNLKLNYARSLIQSEHISSVNDITQMVGLSSVSYFIKTFKNKFGVTPKEMMYKIQDNHQ